MSGGEGKMRILRKAVTIVKENCLPYAVGLVIAAGFKYHYRAADVDDLGWILIPIVRLVELLTGIHFEHELYAGFISRSHRIIITPSCAGINFFVICFSTLFFPLVSRFAKSKAKFMWLAGSLCAAYTATLWTNTLRIIVSIYLYGADIYNSWITPERMHRFEGIVIYVSFLLIAYLVAERITGYPYFANVRIQKTARSEAKGFISVIRVLSIPFIWYVLIAVFIPLLNIANYQKGSLFAEHVIFVVAVSLCVLLVCLSVAAFLCKSVDIPDERERK